MLRVFVALGFVVAIGISLVAVDQTGSARSAPTIPEPRTEVATVAASPDITDGAPPPTTVDNITVTTVTPVPPPTAPPVTVGSPPGNVALRPAFGDERARAIAAGTPGAFDTSVIASSCNGDGGRPHWGYFNNGAAGGTVFEPDGAVVPLGAVCLNPAQPDPYSSLVHELGHKWFWDNGTWDESAATFGSTERAAECFARVFGATVFGAGGCPDSLVGVMAAILGR